MFKKLDPLNPYLYRYRVQFVWGGLALFLNNAIWILFPQVIGRAINDLTRGITQHKIVTYSVVLIAIALSKGFFQYLMRRILIGISREIEFDLRNDLFRHLESLSYSYYQRTRVGDIMARATNDLNAVRMLLGPAIMYTANTIIFTAGALLFMLKISPRLTMFAFLPLPVASILVQYFGRRIHERFERIQATFSDISARAQENFSGARLVRAYVQEESEIELFETANREYIARSLKLVRLIGMLWPTLETLLGLAIILVLWLGGREVLLHRMDVGQFVAYNTYMVQLTWPVIALGWVINIFQRGTASLRRINEIFEEKPTVTDAAVASDLKAASWIHGDIEFHDLSFAYPTGGKVLEGINLHIPEGSSLAIVGPTGSGKSTLVSLIPRIYDAARGSLLINGRNITDYPLALLRKNIGFVPQETFLFSSTIRENIAFGAEASSDAEVKAAAEAASIAQEIESFSQKYDTIIGERGLT
ncbi:MAG TPA: ABC transporter transmembrane domain-containing protein, partial [Terriglobales bacterium]|nr:ABC transporter transmembrane domain-containing protein [Terriglobales bacterium]